jgi:flagellin
MSTSINTNISALAAQGSLRKTALAQDNAMERLSTGIRINSAKDDAAGLAISTRMTANIRGISAAIRNANDGISLTQTAEGSLSAIGDNLQRIRELAVQSANTGNNASDRGALNAEAQQLVAEIDRVANNSAFNGIKLLDGSFQNQSLQVGSGNDANDRISISINSAKAAALGVGSNTGYQTKIQGVAVGTDPLAANALALNGVMVGASTSDGVSSVDASASGISIANAVNNVSSQTGVTATVNATKTNTVKALTVTATTTAGGSWGAGAVKINGIDLGAFTATAGTAGDQASAAASQINTVSDKTGVVATASGAVISLRATDGRDITISTDSTAAVTSALGLTASSSITQSAGYGSTITGFGTAIAAGNITINGVALGKIDAALSAGARGGQMSAAINAISTRTGVTATFDTTTGNVSLAANDGRNISISVNGVSGAAITSEQTGLVHTTGGTTAGTFVTTTLKSVVTLSSSSKEGVTISAVDTNSAAASGFKAGVTSATTVAGSGVSTISLLSAASSQNSLTVLDSAINTITDARAAMGAYQNRLTASITNLETTSMNLQASRSRILDTDYAKETTNLAKAQIVQQAATAMLAQANQSAQSVLALLK